MSLERAHIEDQILVMDAQDGNAMAMDHLVHRWQRRLWQHAYRLTADQDGAWEVMQQTWHDIIKGLPKLRDPAGFRAWAYKITTHKAINWIKKQMKHRHVSLEAIQDRPAKTQKDTGVTELLEGLSAAKKAVVSLYYFERLTILEISVALNIPPGTVKSRLHTARQELKALWEQESEP